ncbi:alpha/beta fold hydrolase [Desulfobacula toluolica]|uniref:Alpha/beta hydrolase fold protein n=1 Tax=Desulfobacula toluolica (strain DSM 7467 / Tol2) TaxID=651182 RepID=K0NCI7_DESTT|nr:alpha/beta hydrolase [Desulfobacula toluolica]CCK82214.1 alpha/beta hydrolase fold protein [Desulfobacula toluolica Tol2]
MNSTCGYTVCGNGPCIVLLHSSMSSKNQWKPLISLMAPKFQLISIDLSGYGDNDLPMNHQTFSTDDEICLVSGIIEKEIGNTEPFQLVAHSYGGAIALKMAAELPHRVASLTLFEPVPFHLLHPDEPACIEITSIIDQLTRALKEENKRSATQLFIDYWSEKGTFEKLKPVNKDALINYIDKVVLDFQALINESLTLEDYSNINIPVCLIKGEKSPLSAVRLFRILAKTLPEPFLYSVPGGHMSPVTDFKTVNSIIEQFLTLPELSPVFG